MTVSVVPLLLVTLSYFHIILSVLKINSKEGRMKAFSACTSHLLVVGTYFSSIVVVFVSYRVDIPVDVHVMSNVVFSILTPLLNPMIYTLRNKEVKSAVKSLFFWKSFPFLKNSIYLGKFYSSAEASCYLLFQSSGWLRHHCPWSSVLFPWTMVYPLLMYFSLFCEVFSRVAVIFIIF